MTSAPKDFQGLILWFAELCHSTSTPAGNTFVPASHNGSKTSLCRLPCKLALCYWLIYTIILILFDWEIDPFSDYSRKSRDSNLSSLHVSWPVLRERSCALSAVVLKASWKAGSCNQGFHKSSRGGSFLPTYGFPACPILKTSYSDMHVHI